MSKPEFSPLEPAHYRRSVFGGYVERDDGPACTRMEVGDRRPDGSVVVGVVPVDPMTDRGFDELVKRSGGVRVPLNPGGDGILDPSMGRHQAQEDLRRAMAELNSTNEGLAAYLLRPVFRSGRTRDA